MNEAIAGGMAVVQRAIADDGSFVEYVQAVLASKALTQFCVLLGAGCFGVAANYLYKWLRDEIRGSLWNYLGRQYPKRTLLSFATLFGYAVVTIMSPALDGAGWTVVLNLGLTTGFAIDALVNKADRSAWTDEERAERSVRPPEGR